MAGNSINHSDLLVIPNFGLFIMGAERMSSLALLNMFPDRDINLHDVLKSFDDSGHRRTALLFLKTETIKKSK